MHGAGVETDDASLQLLATHYSPMRYPEDREALAGRLAQNRAEAIVKALVDRGVAKERLAVGARASGHRTEMEVEPMDGLKEDEADLLFGVRPAWHEFTVTCPSSEPPQEVTLTPRRVPCTLTVKLRNRHHQTGHWSRCLPLPNGVPIAIEHERLALDRGRRGAGRRAPGGGHRRRRPAVRQRAVQHQGVRDGALRRRRAPRHAARRLQRGDHPARARGARISLWLETEDPRAKEERQVAEAAADPFMEGRTVHFNGAGDHNLPRIEQAWSVDFMFDDTKRMKNLELLNGIADIMEHYPLLGLEVHGETVSDVAPKLLADYYDLDPSATCSRSATSACTARARRRA